MKNFRRDTPEKVLLREPEECAEIKLRVETLPNHDSDPVEDPSSVGTSDVECKIVGVNEEVRIRVANWFEKFRVESHVKVREEVDVTELVNSFSTNESWYSFDGVFSCIVVVDGA